MNLQNRRSLFMIAGATSVVCIVILFFFRTQVFVSAGRRVVSILEPFIYGAVIAWLLHPLSRKAEQLLYKLLDPSGTGRLRGLIRLLSVILALLFLLAVLALLLFMVIPELITSISGLVRQLPAAVKRFENWLNSLEFSGPVYDELVTNFQTIIDTLTGRLQEFLKTDLLPGLETYFAGMLSSFRSLLGLLKNLGLGCIIAIYLMMDWEKFGAQTRLVIYAILPKNAADWLCREIHFSNQKFSGFIIGKIVDSLIIGIICFIFVSITNMPYGMLVSIIVGVTNLIPFFGPYLGAIPSAILILTASPVKCLIFIVFIVILQQFDGNLLGPMILGDRLGLSGFWILFAILVFGSLWGILGMFIGAPVFAVLYDLMRSAVRSLLAKREQQQMLSAYDIQYPREQEEKKKKKKKTAATEKK